MNSSSFQDVSLYELAHSLELAPRPLQVSPTIFKSLVSTLMDLLLDQKIPATLWLKLPRGEAWQSEIERFQKLTRVPSSIYILSSHQEDFEKRTVTEFELSHTEPEAIADEPKDPPYSELEPTHQSDSDDGLAQNHEPQNYESQSSESRANESEDEWLERDLTPPVTGHAGSLTLPLAAESNLRREYFLLVLSGEFCGLVLAHRPRTGRSPRDADNQEVLLNHPKPIPGEEEIDRKHPLLGLFTLNPKTIQQVLEGIHRAVCCGQSQAEPTAEIEELLVNWDGFVEQAADCPLNPTLLSHLFTKQIQRQEEIWYSTAVWRRQADAAATLQLENEELLHSIRLKDEFLKNVGQELRTPLTTMKTALTLLASPNLKPTQRQRYMDMLTQECDRQSSLITSVLDLVQIEDAVDAPMQPLRLIEAIPGIVSIYQPLAQEKGVMLAYTVPEDLPAVSCLHNWLRQIVINLLHNSIKFTPKGGQVWVKAKQQGDYIQVEVRDTGIGIPPAEIPKVFDRFYRVRQGSAEEQSGAGLGLSIVRQLLLRCGGSISVRSKPGEGSAFTVLLPLYSYGHKR
ncbi:MAG: histidine kinase [Leptolyngbyaceae cyanobacterium RM2_2_4]|nr:histidine kinase [Leptolyngbyaceae cyanobacterium RM2_2_4]